MVIGQAADRLAAEPWTIEHPAGWPGEDAAWIEQTMKQRGLPPPVLHEDTGITAGLRVRLGSACLDATIEGLLCNRREVEGRLLAAWERQLPKQAEAANG